MESMLSSESESELWVSVESLPEYLRGRGVGGLTHELLRPLLDRCLLPSFSSLDGGRVVLVEDLQQLRDVLTRLSASPDKHFSEDGFFTLGGLYKLEPAATTSILFASDGPLKPPAVYPLARSLIRLASNECIPNGTSGPSVHLPLMGSTRISTSSEGVKGAVQQALDRSDVLLALQHNDFARSAYYMGSKRRLASFLVEGLFEYVAPGSKILDLMCGSGAASAAFSRFWETYASDAQSFCRVLANVQGSGFSPAEASETLSIVVDRAREHFATAAAPIADWIKLEDYLFHSERDQAALSKYQEMIREFPTLKNKISHGSWDPVAAVLARRDDSRLQPYYLFVAYFANVFFGIRQAVEIDSLRCAIEELESTKKDWAMGALIATVSTVASTFGGHFAQPGFKSPNHLSLKSFQKALLKRSGSVFHEFSARLLSIAQASSGAEWPVTVLPGPWETALREFDVRAAGGPAIVYLDAPYTREEYSRYYHVLETLVRYDYPEALGNGLVPRKGNGTNERYSSPFFTKNKNVLERLIAHIITEVIGRGYTCAWSYAEPAMASIPAVLSLVQKQARVSIASVAAPFEHKAHRAQGLKPVTEYLVVIRPK